MTVIQRYIVHVIRNSKRYLSYKDRKVFVSDLKPVYTAIDETQALEALSNLEEK